jgi:uncharacterized protein
MDKKGLVIADTGPIISLAVVDKLHLLSEIFDDVFIPQAVWNELTNDNSREDYKKVVGFFSDKVKAIVGFNNLAFAMDYGEAEAVILYNEISADYLLIDDKKARNIAETLNIKCIGTIGLIAVAKQRELIDAMRPLFIKWIEENRFYSIKLLNRILEKYSEQKIVI